MRCLTFCTLLLMSSLAFAQPKELKIPSDITVIATGPDIPKDLAAFSGKWSGTYNGLRTGDYQGDGLIVVHQITSPKEIEVYYTGIGRQRTNPSKLWERRHTATYDGNSVEFQSEDCRMRLTLTSNRAMNVAKDCNVGGNRGRYTRVD